MQIPLGMPGVAPRRTDVGHFLNDISSFGTGVVLHFDGIKEFERATMTRIGHCRIPLLAMLPPARQSRPAQNFPDQTASTNISVPTSLGCILTTLGPQAFFESHIVARRIAGRLSV